MWSSIMVHFQRLRANDDVKMPPPSARGHSNLMKPLAAIAMPGMYLYYKFNQYKQQHAEQQRRKVTERELEHLNVKIDKLLTRIDENEPDTPGPHDDECVVCLQAPSTMQTFPCGHTVVCRKCLVKTIQVAVTQRCLPLRCVVCRTKILKLRQTTVSATASYSRHSSTSGQRRGLGKYGASHRKSSKFRQITKATNKTAPINSSIARAM